MSGLAGLALGTAPIAGGALLAAAAGQLKGPFKTADFRELIKQDQDLLKGVPPEQTARRAELQRTIDERIDDLIAATDRTARYVRRPAAIRATGMTWCCVSASCCSPSSGGMCPTAGPIGCRCSSC
jgi:hypothetical protein